MEVLGIMKKIILIYLISITMIYGKENFYIKSGLSYSYLIHEKKSDPLFSYIVGIGKDWRIKNNFFITTEIIYTIKGSTLKEKIILPPNYMGYFYEGKKVYSNYILIKISYIEIPILLKYKIKNEKNYSLNFITGVSYSIPYKDLSKITKKKYLFEINSDYETSNYTFDYGKRYEPTWENYKSGYLYHLGFNISYKNFGIEIIYSMDSRNTIWIDHLTGINKKMRNININFIFLL